MNLLLIAQDSYEQLIKSTIAAELGFVRTLRDKHGTHHLEPLRSITPISYNPVAAKRDFHLSSPPLVPSILWFMMRSYQYIVSSKPYPSAVISKALSLVGEAKSAFP